MTGKGAALTVVGVFEERGRVLVVQTAYLTRDEKRAGALRKDQAPLMRDAARRRGYGTARFLMVTCRMADRRGVVDLICDRKRSRGFSIDIDYIAKWRGGHAMREPRSEEEAEEWRAHTESLALQHAFERGMPAA